MAISNTKLEDIFNVGSSTYGIGSDVPEAQTSETIETLVDSVSSLEDTNKLEKMIADYEDSQPFIQRDKIDSALPEVLDLEKSEKELDEIAEMAVKGYQDLSELGQNVEVRHAAEIFNAANTLLGHALTAKKNKIEKKLKVIELQIKKYKIDQDKSGKKDEPARADSPKVLEGRIISHRELLAEYKTEFTDKS
jgi:hypothetical protein